MGKCIFSPFAPQSLNFVIWTRFHPKGEKWDLHYHKEGTEINLLIKGKMIMQGKELSSGDVFIVYPYEISDPVFLEDCAIVCVKTPSSTEDKFCLKEA